MKYSSDIVNKVIESVDIVDLIGENVRLTRRGRNYIGLCPFHQEKTPSFIVSPDKSIYKCFGCSKGGNAISFMIDFHSYSFNEAIKELGNKYGVQLPKEADFNKESDDRREQLFRSLNDSAAYFNKLLYTKEGKETLAYLKSRDFDDNAIAKFSLGHSPDASSNLFNYLKNAGYNEDTLIANGIVFKNDRNHIIDRFRNRAIFPIRDYIGRVVGFGARYMGDDKTQAKYINSPQNEVYDKSNVIYGLFEAKNAIRTKGFAILTEGYADVITLSQKGIENVIASSGTALTNRQLILLKRFANKIYISYDGDEAGLKAAESAAELALSAGFDVLIITLPDQEDPDSFVRKHGAEKYEYHLRKANTYLEFKIDRIKEKQNINTPFALSGLLKTLLEVVAKIPDEIQHDFYLREIANRLSLSEQQLKEAYLLKNKFRDEFLVQFDKEANYDYNHHFLNNEKEQSDPEAVDLSKLHPEEKLILKIAVKGNDELLHLYDYTDFEDDTLISQTARTIFEIITVNSEFGDIVNSIVLGDYPQSIKDAILTLRMDDALPSENWYSLLNIDKEEVDEIRIIKDSVRKLHSRKTINQLEQVKKLMINEPENLHHLERFNELKKKEIILQKPV